MSDGTPEAFQRDFARIGRNPCYAIVGAWAGSFLEAFMTALVVDDWVYINTCAASDHLILRPVDGLIHFGLDYYLVQNRFHTVGYGVSSIQEVSKAETLDRFKKKVGFEARPIHRTFVFHPLLSPFANSLTLWGLRLGTRLRPGSRGLRKATGLLASYLGKQHLLSESEQQDTTEAHEDNRQVD